MDPFDPRKHITVHQHNGMNGSSGKAQAEHERAVEVALAEQFNEVGGREREVQGVVGVCQTKNCTNLDCRENFCSADHFIR